MTTFVELKAALSKATKSRKESRECISTALTLGVTFIVKNEAEREQACEAFCGFLDFFRLDSEWTNIRGWLKAYFPRIGVEYDSKSVKKVTFKSESEKADDFAGAEANPYWLMKAREAEDAEAEKKGMEELRALLNRCDKQLAAFVNGNATNPAKARAKKARAALALI